MCVNGRYIRNKYTGQRLFVKCGKCHACLQQKAFSRSSRARSEVHDGDLVLSVTLTYYNKCLPYIKYTDFKNANDITPVKVYRDSRLLHSGEVTSGKQVLKEVYLSSKDGKIKIAKRKNNAIGVIYYKDVQDFVKRVRIRLSRTLGYSPKVRFIAASEYGPKTFRPHFHVLMYAKKEVISALRSACIQSWPYGDMQNPRRCEIAHDMANYVSSYINCGSDFPDYLEKNFKPKHSFSKYFGHDTDLWKVSTLLDCADKCNFIKTVSRVSETGVRLVDFHAPQYIINSFFPKFKGDGLFTGIALHNFLSRPYPFLG